MTRLLGSASLLVALGVALYGALALFLGARRSHAALLRSGRLALYAVWALVTVATLAMVYALVAHDFSVKYVAMVGSRATPLFYTVISLWGALEGSILFWIFVLASLAALVTYQHRRREGMLVPYAGGVLLLISVFFLILLVGPANPFTLVSPVPPDGPGPNPLLQNHPLMAVHPPLLYLGYVGMSVPFAFAIGAVLSGEVEGDGWIRLTRRWTLAAWMFLTAAIVAGMWWSYEVLGWGGYWAWDPVENAALIPWLTGTAFLHSIMVQERRGMLRVWNVSLICATFALSLLGTFLVRSGVLQSIHAFGESKVGPPLLALIAVVVIGSTVLIVSRLDSLRTERRLDSLFSREAIFLLNNVLLVGLAAVVAWGTFFPLISEAVTGEASSLAAPWFNRYATPLAILLVLFMGIGPLVAWRRVTLTGIARAIAVPLAATLVAAIALALAVGIAESVTAYLLFCVATFALAAVGQEFWRGTVARRRLAGGSRAAALGSLLTRNRRRYGGYVAHVGLVLALFGVAASSSFQTSRDLRLSPGDQAPVGDFTISYERPTVTIDGGEQKLALGAVLDVSREGRHVTTLSPSREYYSGAAAEPDAPLRSFFEGEATSEVGRTESFSRDLWSAMQPDLSGFDRVIDSRDRRYAEALSGLSGAELADPRVQAVIAQAQGQMVRRLADRYLADPPPAEIRFNVNPFVVWFWLGVIVAVGGALFAIWPTPEGRRRRVSDVYGAR
ncbi:MAG: heme lyase CcmF/NrfE family subunit, partial [Gemmatimonadaceae bacterium]|nr:heme lyase CcmF/NrfE family subunit [Gemmatimonadaceae bacterium]